MQIFFQKERDKHTHREREEIHTKGGKSSRTCRATHIHLGQKASEFSQWHIEGFPSKDELSFVQ